MTAASLGREHASYSVPLEERVEPNTVGDGSSLVLTTRHDGEKAHRLRAQSFFSIRNAIILFDLAGRILDWSPAAERLYGYSRVEALGKTLALIFPSADADALTLAMLERVSRDGVWADEVAFVRKDGAGGLSEVSASPLLDEGGRVIGVVGVHHDITERKRAEAERIELLARERRARAEAEAERAQLRAIIEVLPVGVAIYDGNGELLKMNQAGQQLTSQQVRPGEDPQARLARYVMRRADGSPMPERESPSGRSRRGETFTNLEYIIEGAQGDETRILTSGAPLPPDPALDPSPDAAFDAAPAVATPAGATATGSVVVFVDVTEQRRLEADQAQARAEIQRSEAAAQARANELEAILEAMTDGVMVYGPGGRVIRANAAVTRLFGYDLIPNFTDLPLTERMTKVRVRDATGQVIPVERLPQMRALAGETLRGADAVDLLISTLYDTEIEVSASAAPLRDASGAIVGSVTVYRDVTEQRRLTRELANQARELEGIFETMTAPVVLFDANGTILRVNKAARDLYIRVGGEDIYHRPFDERRLAMRLMDELGRPLPPELWPARRILSGDASVGSAGADVQFVTRDGQTLSMSLSGMRLLDADGAVTGGIAIYQDVTSRRLLERRTQEALDALLEMAQTLVALPDDLNADLNATATVGVATGDEVADDVSVAMRQQMTAQVERAIAQRLAMLTCGVLGCKRVGITSVDPESDRLRAVAVVGLTPEQETRWWEEQRAMEAAGARLSDGADPGELARFRGGEVFVLDMSQPPLSELPNPYGVTTQLIAPMRAGDRLVGMLSLDYGGPPHVFTEEERAVAYAVAQLGAAVLERERLLHERAEAHAQALALTEANRRMDEFLSIASHELRTPLTTIKANVQIAERRLARLRDTGVTGWSSGADDASQERSLDQALEPLARLLGSAVSASERQERLVQDLLDVSRIAAGKLDFRMEEIDLALLVREVVAEQRLTARGRSISVTAPRKPVRIYADADRIRQALTNYITNALKYSLPDMPVSVALRRMGDRRTSELRVEVQDAGPGLTAEQQRHLFERFYRAPGIDVQSGSGVGLGLGLYIARTIVEQHSGRVGVESVIGQGSTFWFTLPCGPHAAVDAHEWREDLETQ